MQVNRRGVSVRSRRAFVLSAARTPRRGDPGDVLADILKSPFGVADLPLRVTTFARQDASGEKVRLLLSADIGQPGMPAQQFDVGYALIDANGAVVASGADRRMLSPANGNPAAMLEYLGEVVVDPGVYTLRLAVVDSEGRRGGVVRDVNAWKLSGEEFALGDLMVGDIQNPADARGMRPAVEPRVGGTLGAYIEFYSNAAAGLAGATVTFEIANAVKEIKAGKVEFRVDKTGIIHAPVGKTSFDTAKLVENAHALVDSVVKAKPSAAKGKYLKSVTVSSTMGPGVAIDTTHIDERPRH